MTLVALNGKMGSGKDTAGERLAEMANIPAYQLSFAKPLKKSAAALLDIPVEDWETYKHDSDVKIYLTVGYTEEKVEQGQREEIIVEAPNVIKEFTAREFLQRYGTESHREIFGSDFWVEQALGTYQYNMTSLHYLTDCRFINEAVAVRDLGGFVVNVIGPDDETGDHPSEVPLPESLIHFVIDNTIRDDNYASLDGQLRSVAYHIGIPLQEVQNAY